MENFKEIPGYSNYLISTDGKIYSKKSNRFLNPWIDNHGYCIIRLSGNNNALLVHRLVAVTYIPNPDNKLTVDHINRIKTDNRVENLRWATAKEQVDNQREGAHEYRIKRASEIISREIEMRDKDNHEILYKTFSSAYQAAIQEFNNAQHNSLIHRCAKGKRDSAYGYWWCYN